MTFYYEKHPSPIDSYIKIHKLLNHTKQIKKTKKVKLIILVNGLYRILYRLVLFINICKQISRNFTNIQVDRESKRELYWNGIYPPSYRKRKRRLKKRFLKWRDASKINKRSSIDSYELSNLWSKRWDRNTKRRSNTYNTTYVFYIWRKTMNFIYKVKKKELSLYIKKKEVKKLLKRKVVLIWFVRKIKKMYRTYDLRFIRGERFNRRFYKTRIFRRKKKRNFLKINRNRTIRRLLKYLNKYMYFKKEKKKPSLLWRHKYIRRGRKKKKAISLSVFFKKHPEIWYSNIEFNFFLKLFYGFNIDFYTRAAASLSINYKLNDFFQIIDRSFYFLIKSSFFIYDFNNWSINGESLDNSYCNSIFNIKSLKVLNIGDFVEFNNKNTKSTNQLRSSPDLTNDIILLFNLIYTIKNTVLRTTKELMLKTIYSEGHRVCRMELIKILWYLKKKDESNTYKNMVFKKIKLRRTLESYIEFDSIFGIYNRYIYNLSHRPIDYKNKENYMAEKKKRFDIGKLRKKNIFFFLFKKHLITINSLIWRRRITDPYVSGFTSLLLDFDSDNYNYFNKSYFHE